MVHVERRAPPPRHVFLLHAFAVIVTGLSLLGVAVLAFWMRYPYAGITLQPNLMRIDQAVVAPGSYVSYWASYCSDAALPAGIQIDRELELQDESGLAFPVAPPLTYEIAVPCETRHRAFGLPSYLPSGIYHLHGHVRLRVNPVREIRQEIHSTDFRVAR